MSYASMPASRQEQDVRNSVVDYTAAQSLSEVWAIAAHHFGDTVALKDPHHDPEVHLTYAEVYRQLQQFAAGLQALGVKPGDRVSLFADNSPRWFIADQGSIMAGAVNVVRSSQADPAELVFILEDSGSTALIVENLATLKKLQPLIANLPLRCVALLSDESPGPANIPKELNFAQLLEAGAYGTVQAMPAGRDKLATLLYTSGTTGRPKGVMLSHGNLLHQINTLRAVIQPQPGAFTLSILPTWHSFGRTVEYFLLSQGCTQIYTNIRHIKRDLQTFKPDYMASVPRLWESIYEGIQKQFRDQPPSRQKLIHFFFAVSQRYVMARRIVQRLSLTNLHPSVWEDFAARLQMTLLAPLHRLGDQIVYQKVRDAMGGNFKQSVSGGGSLAMHLENFFEIVGIDLLVGYGLTETSPVLTARRPWRNLRRSAGQAIPETEIQIVDPLTHQPVPQDTKGLVMARGPQIMQGYYQNPEATAKAIDAQGWFNTGDLGWLTEHQDLILTGRAKDTIVLSSGENIEPQPIEDACARSPYIDQIVVVGQDQRVLGALIVPNLEALEAWAIAQNLHLHLPEQNQPVSHQPSAARREKAINLQPLPPNSPYQDISLDSKPVQDLYRQELTREVKNRPGYRVDDRVGPFRFILEPFSIENGMMTQTLKIRRSVVMERYHDMINGMFD